MTDIKEVTDDELARMLKVITDEQDRRRTLATAGQAMDDIARSVLAATGQIEGGEWVQPTDATNAYPKDWAVSHGGKTWVSLTPANVWEPGISGWRESVEENTAPDWVQPTGALDAYNTGDHVMFDGSVYESLIDSNTWSPIDYPAGWHKVEE